MRASLSRVILFPAGLLFIAGAARGDDFSHQWRRRSFPLPPAALIFPLPTAPLTPWRSIPPASHA